MAFDKCFVVVYLMVAVWVISQIQAKNITTSPENISIVNVSSTQATIFWSAVTGEEVTGYIICLSQGGDTICNEILTDRLNFTYDYLQPETNYLIRISAISVSEEGTIQEGPFSEINFNTAATKTPSITETPFVNIINRVEPKTPVINEPSQDISIVITTLSELEDYSFKQECNSSGTPQPEIKWTSNTNITSNRDLTLQPGDVSIYGDVNPYIFTCTSSNSEGEDTRSIRIRIDIDLTDEIEKLENVTVEIVKKFSKVIAKNIQGVNVTYEEPSVSRELIDRNADHLVNLVIKYNESDISGEEKKEAIGSLLYPAGDITQKEIELNYENDETVDKDTKIEEGKVASATRGLTDTLDSLEILGLSLIIDIPTNITTSVSISSPTVTLIAENYLLSAENDSSMITIPDSLTIEDKGIEERIQIPIQVARLLSTNNNTNFKIGTAIVKNTLKPKDRDSDKKATNLFSNIITVVIPGYENRVQMIPLPEPVRILVPVISEKASNKQQICSFLNNSLWSTNGLTTDATEYNVTYCYTDHFTSFAVFVTPRESPIDDLSRIASLVSYVLVSISLVALVVSLILFIISGKYFFKVEANIVYFNYCLAMTLAFGLFLFGIESGKFHPIACMVIAFLLHYIWLAVFVWTLCNGILIVYKLTIGILRDHKIYPYLICFGWISPIIIPIITIAIKHNNYVKSEEHCFITYQDGIIWSFIGPILIILAMNMIILVFASIRIATVKFGTNKIDEKQALKIGIIYSLILTPLLGIPWVLLLVNVFISDPIVQWVFIIVNSLMGVFFFFAVTIRSTEVKRLCTWSSTIEQQPSTSLTGGKMNAMLSNKFKKSTSKEGEQVTPSKVDANKKGEYFALDVLTDVSSPTSPTDVDVVSNETRSKPKLLPKPKLLTKPKLLPKPKNLPNPKGYSKGSLDTGEYLFDIPEDVKPIDPSNIYDFLKPKTKSGVYTELDVENNMPEIGKSDTRIYQILK